MSDSSRPYADNKQTYTALAENLLKASSGEDWAAARELIYTEARAEPVPAKKEEVKPVAAVVEESKETVAEAAPEQEAAESKQETAAESKEPAQED